MLKNKKLIKSSGKTSIKSIPIPVEWEPIITRMALERLSSFSNIVKLAVREYLRAEGHNVE